MMTREEIGAIRKRAEKVFSDTFVYSGPHSLAHELVANDIPKLLAEIERLQTNWQWLEEYAYIRREEAFAFYESMEGEGARNFYGGVFSAFTSVRDKIQTLD
ncbi:hypothetical protein ABE137_03685 [Brevibacillus laterosporus]|uniref:hypothetical protein n=1 Tax=Brevibacillus laterosporus TaxID=1465 RepID=UPI003D1DBB2F